MKLCAHLPWESPGPDRARRGLRYRTGGAASALGGPDLRSVFWTMFLGIFGSGDWAMRLYFSGAFPRITGV